MLNGSSKRIYYLAYKFKHQSTSATSLSASIGPLIVIPLTHTTVKSKINHLLLHPVQTPPGPQFFTLRQP